MRLLERNPWLWGLGVGLAVFTLTGAKAGAQPPPVLNISSTVPGSLVIFPKLIADGTRDSIVAITNTSNLMVYAHCEYTNGAGTCEGAPAGQRYFCETGADCQNVTAPDQAILADVGPCVRNWQTGNFDIALTAQQPTFWRVSTGRTFNPNLGGDPVCVPSGSSQACPGLFLGINNAFGSVPLPPRTGEFRGELRCVQTDMVGGLSGANALKGEAIIEVNVTNGTQAPIAAGISKYNSINVEAGSITVNDRRVVLDGQQYAACPEGITANHLAANVSDPAAESVLAACAGNMCPVRTELTYVPCSQNYQLELPVGFSPELARFDEQEQRISLEPNYQCWANQATDDPLANIWDGLFANSVFMRTTAVESAADARDTLPVGGMCIAGDSYGQSCDVDANCLGGAAGSCGPQSALLGVVESFYETPLSMTAIGTSAESMLQISTDLTDDADPRNAIARSGRTAGGLACAVGVAGCRFDEILFTEP